MSVAQAETTKTPLIPFGCSPKNKRRFDFLTQFTLLAHSLQGMRAERLQT
jgi:hypothetical protein